MQTTMPSPDEQLDQDSLLLLYLAGELPPLRQAEISRRLSTDAGFSARLDALREAQERVEALLAELDRRERLAVQEGVAVRRVSRAMAQWAIDRAVMPAAKKRNLAPPWWAYPSAVAAAIVVAFLVWSVHQPIAGMPPEPGMVASQDQPGDDDANALADRLEKQFAMTPELTSDNLIRPVPAHPQDDDGGFFIGQEEAAW